MHLICTPTTSPAFLWRSNCPFNQSFHCTRSMLKTSYKQVCLVTTRNSKGRETLSVSAYVARLVSLPPGRLHWSDNRHHSGHLYNGRWVSPEGAIMIRRPQWSLPPLPLWWALARFLNKGTQVWCVVLNLWFESSWELVHDNRPSHFEYLKNHSERLYMLQTFEHINNLTFAIFLIWMEWDKFHKQPSLLSRTIRILTCVLYNSKCSYKHETNWSLSPWPVIWRAVDQTWDG